MAKIKEVSNILEEWLKNIAVSGGICFPEKFKLYAPTCYGKCEDAVDELVKDINLIFGGSTTYKDVEGCWWDDENKKLECEPIRVIETAHHCQDYETARKLSNAIIKYNEKAKQKYISISQGSFYILPSEKIKI